MVEKISRVKKDGKKNRMVKINRMAKKKRWIKTGWWKITRCKTYLS